MSSYQKIKIFIVNKKNVYQVVIFDKYCMYKEFKLYIFFSPIFCYYALLFCREVSSKKYYCSIFVQSWSAYTTTDRSKKRLVKDDLFLKKRKKYHYYYIFVQSWSAYTTTDRSKMPLVRITFIKEACHEFMILVSE